MPLSDRLAAMLGRIGGRRRFRAAQQRIDALYGTETLEVVPLDRFTARGAPLASAYEYHPTPVPAFDRALAALPIDRSDHVFIDMGCGKGLALMLAAGAGFGRIVGVEFEPALCAAARANLARFRAAARNAPPIEVLQEDASRYAFPPSPMMLYLYNPFGPEIVRKLLANLRRSLDEQPRSCWIVYLKPLHHDLFAASGFLDLRSDAAAITAGDHAIYEASAAGMR